MLQRATVNELTTLTLKYFNSKKTDTTLSKTLHSQPSFLN